MFVHVINLSYVQKVLPISVTYVMIRVRIFVLEGWSLERILPRVLTSLLFFPFLDFSWPSHFYARRFVSKPSLNRVSNGDSILLKLCQDFIWLCGICLVVSNEAYFYSFSFENGNGNGLLFHMTQPISRSTIKAIVCSKPTISEH